MSDNKSCANRLRNRGKHILWEHGLLKSVKFISFNQL